MRTLKNYIEQHSKRKRIIQYLDNIESHFNAKRNSNAGSLFIKNLLDDPCFTTELKNLVIDLVEERVPENSFLIDFMNKKFRPRTCAHVHAREENF